MSPLWRDRLFVALAPGRVAAVRLGRGWRPRVRADGVRDAIDEAPAGKLPWAGALAALDQLLAEVAPAGGTADVVLSNQFVRFGQVPWTRGVYADTDRSALAAGCFRTAYGEAADTWRVTLDSPAYGHGSLAAAVDQALVDELRRLLTRRRLDLASLQPHLTAALRHWRSRINRDDGAFVVAEPGCVTALFRRQDRWNQVVSRRCRDGFADEATDIIRQSIEADRLQGGGGTVALLAAGPRAPAAGPLPWRLLAGDAGPWPEDPWRSMAWSAT